MILADLTEQAAKTGECVGFVVIMRPDGAVAQTLFQFPVSELDKDATGERYGLPAFEQVLAEVQGKEPPVELPAPEPLPDVPEALILAALEYPSASDLAPGRLGHAIAAVRFALSKPIRDGAPDLAARLETLKTAIVEAKEARVG
jgi:hypothetical protein